MPDRPGDRGADVSIPAVRRMSLLVALAALACRGGDRLALHSRYLVEDPTAVLLHEQLIEAEPVLQWGRGACLAEEGWRVDLPSAEHSCTGGVLRITPSQRYVTLSRPVDFDANEVDSFELVVEGMPRQQAGAEWIREGEQFGPAQRVEGSVRVDSSSSTGRVRLPVHGRPQWSGRIRGIRLSLIVPPHGSVRLVSFAAVDERVDRQRLERLAGVGRKIDLDNEMRGGLLGLPRSPIRWRTELAEGGELRLAFGVLGRCADPVTFEVDALAGSSDFRQRLFARTLPCDSGGWQEARVPIGRKQSGVVTLELRTSSSGELDPMLGVPVWGDLQVLARRPDDRLNLLLISVDTLRPDHLSLYGYPHRTTPNLEAWSQRGSVIFERAIAAAPWTLPSHVSLLSGLDAIRHGVNHNRGVPPSLLTLAQIMRRAGYATRAVTGGGFVHQQYGFASGFDAYSSFSERMGFENELEAGIAKAKALLELDRERSFFLFFHTYAVHNPFRPRQPYHQRLTGRSDAELVDVDVLPPEPVDGFRARRALILTRDDQRVQAPADEVNRLAASFYDSNIAYTDEKLGELLQAMDDLGLMGRTLIVFTSDHGELFGEHGLVNHISLFDENVRVPLVVLDPRRGRGVRRVAAQVRSIDIFPTVLELLGVAVPPGIDGRSLTPWLADDAWLAGDAERTDAGIAWSYAPGSNFGVSLRRADGTTYIARNDAWVSAGPREEASRADVPIPEESVATLREAAEEKLRRDLAGVRILGRNTGTEPFSIAVWGRDIQPTRLKVARFGQGALDPARSSPAVLDVPPGGERTLVIEGRRVAPFHLRLDDPHAGSHRFDIDPATLVAARWYGRVEDAWSSRPAPALAGSGVFVWWQGDRDGGGEEPVDEDLQRQLEALGYVR